MVLQMTILGEGISIGAVSPGLRALFFPVRLHALSGHLSIAGVLPILVVSRGPVLGCSLRGVLFPGRDPSAVLLSARVFPIPVAVPFALVIGCLALLEWGLWFLSWCPGHVDVDPSPGGMDPSVPLSVR